MDRALSRDLRDRAVAAVEGGCRAVGRLSGSASARRARSGGDSWRSLIIDNLSSHKAPAIRVASEGVGAKLLFLPPYMPDFSPIEQAFSKLNAHLRKAAERTIHGLWNAIGRILDLYSPGECANYVANCGYDAD